MEGGFSESLKDVVHPSDIQSHSSNLLRSNILLKVPETKSWTENMVNNKIMGKITVSCIITETFFFVNGMRTVCSVTDSTFCHTAMQTHIMDANVLPSIQNSDINIYRGYLHDYMGNENAIHIFPTVTAV